MKESDKRQGLHYSNSCVASDTTTSEILAKSLWWFYVYSYMVTDDVVKSIMTFDRVGVLNYI